MNDFVVALGLVLVIEGAVWALFPDGMKRLMARVMDESAPRLRGAGLFAAILGLILVWAIRG